MGGGGGGGVAKRALKGIGERVGRVAPSSSTEVVKGFKSKLDSIAVSLFGLET